MAAPKSLIDISERFEHPCVAQTGVTLTADGRWALYVQLRKGTRQPVPDVERLAGGFPVVYDEEPETLPVARPAYPSRGE